MLLERLWQRGLHLVTWSPGHRQRRKRKNSLLPLLDKVLSRKRFSIETLFEVLKSSRGLENPPPLAHQCPGPSSLLPGGNHLGTTQDQYRQYRYPQHHAHHPNLLLTLSTTGVRSITGRGAIP
ncbi:MAG: hypothetical protein F4Z73_01275 [Synechococcus sp. SB0668_bin_13]|nr:hypothetical protein [Synechococcus sp. SB0668_bin_13]